MKNEHILRNTEVPYDLRQEVYKQALDIIQNATLSQHYPKWHTPYLCWLLPSLLWGYDAWVSWEESSKSFHYGGTLLMFPELRKHLGNNVSITTNERIAFLKSVIK